MQETQVQSLVWELKMPHAAQQQSLCTPTIEAMCGNCWSPHALEPMLQKSVCWNKDPEQPKINKNYTHTHTHTYTHKPFSSSPLTPWEGPNFFARHTGWGLSCLLRMPSTPTPLPLPCQLGNFSFSHSWFKYCLPDYTVVCAPLQCWLHACCSLHWTVFFLGTCYLH